MRRPESARLKRIGLKKRTTGPRSPLGAQTSYDVQRWTLLRYRLAAQERHSNGDRLTYPVRSESRYARATWRGRLRNER